MPAWGERWFLVGKSQSTNTEKKKTKKIQPQPKLLPKETHSYFFMHRLELINKHEGKKSRLMAQNMFVTELNPSKPAKIS